MKKKIKRVAPWVICGAIFFYLFTQISPQQILKSLKLANLTEFTLYTVIYFMIIHVMDCFTIQRFISRFATPITLKESWIVRGVSYIIMILNYHAAQGAFAIYFKKTHGASFSKTLGTLAFISIMDLLLVLGCAVSALYFSDISTAGFDLRAYIGILAPLVFIGYILWIFFWRNVDHPSLDRFKKLKPINWLLKHDIFLIFREARSSDYLKLLLYRTPMVFIIIGGYNLAITAFQAHIDWLTFYIYNPVILFISTLPITPSGMGTGQFLAIEFFKKCITSPLFAKNLATPESLLLASSLAWTVANQIIKAIFGAACLSLTSKKMFIEETPVNPC